MRKKETYHGPKQPNCVVWAAFCSVGSSRLVCWWCCRGGGSRCQDMVVVVLERGGREEGGGSVDGGGGGGEKKVMSWHIWWLCALSYTAAPTVPRILWAYFLQIFLVQLVYCWFGLLVSNSGKQGSTLSFNNLFYYIILSKDCHSLSWPSPGSFLQESWRKHEELFLSTDQESYQE